MTDFLVVGAQKAGTTSLHRYLSSNNNLFLPDSKELAFFWNEDYFRKGIDWYEQFFRDLAAKSRLTGEVSPQYMYSRKCAERIREYNPDIKIIMCLRDPIERAYSHYRMNVELGTESRSFEAIASLFIRCREESGDPEKSYFGLGMYGKILGWYSECFDERQILFVYSESLRASRGETLKEICEFLGVAYDFDNEVVGREYHSAGKVRFRLIHDLMLHSNRIPQWPKLVVKYLVGEQRLYRLLHKIKTEWNIASRAPEVERPLDSEMLVKIRAAYMVDDDRFFQHASRKHPWLGGDL